MSKQISRNEIAEKGVLDNLLEPLKELLKITDSVDAKLKDTAKTINQSFKFTESSKGLRELEVNLQKTNKLAEQKKKVQQDQTKIEKQLADAKGRLNKLSVQEERLLKARLQTDQQSIKVQDQKTKQLITEERLKQAQLRTDKQIQAEKEKEARQNAKLAKQKADENNAYKQLSKASRDYKNESKRLGAELLKLEQAGDKNTKEFKELSNQYKTVTAQARTTDAQLKKLDSTVGDNQRNVGNYRDATSKLTGALGQLGLAIGVGAVAKGIFDFNKNLSRATNQAQTLFQVSEEGAKKIAKDATIIAKAYDKDVNEVLKAGNVLQRQFGVSSDQAFEILNKGFEKGADVSGELLENVSEYSTQLRLAGLNAEQSISIITQSQQAGVFSDKGIDAIKEATLSLREMTPAAAEALDAIGMSADQVQRDIASGSKTYFDVIQEISARTNDVGENTQAAGMILADVFKGAGEDAGDFIFSLGEMNTELNDLEDTNKGVEGAIQNLTKEFYELVFSLNETTGLSSIFSGVINFLAENLETILKVVTLVGSAFLSYKGAMIAGKVATTAYQVATKGAAIAQALFTGNLKKATAGMRLFNTVTKMNPIGLLISGITAAITAFSLFGDAADDAKRRQKEFNDATKEGAEEGSKIANENLAAVKGVINKKLKELERERDKEIALGADTNEANEKFLKKKESLVEDEIKILERRSEKAVEIGRKEIQELEKQREAANKKVNDALKKSLGIEEDDFSTEAQELRLFKQEEFGVLSLQNQIRRQKESTREQKKAYQEEIKNLQGYQEEVLIEQIKTENTITEEQKEAARKRQNALMLLKRRAEDMEDAAIKDEFERRKQQLNRAFQREMEEIKGNSEIENRLREALEKKLTADLLALRKERADKSVQLVEDELKRVDDAYKAQEDEKQQDIDKELEQLTTALEKRNMARELANLQAESTEEEFNKAEKERQIKHIDEMIALLEEYDDKEDEILALKIERAQLTKKTNKEEVDSLELLKQTVEQVGNAIADTYSNIFQRQIDELKKQEDTAKQVYGTLEKLASEGNIAAQESLAEQLQAQQDAQREQIKLQQKQANIEKARQVYAIIQSQLDAGKSPSQAIAEAGGYMTAIQGLIQSLPSFYEGTEDTGKASKALDSKGGRLAVLHNNERVLTAEQNKHLQGIPNPMIPVLVNKALDSAGNSYDLLAIDELRRTRQAIEKLPQSTYQLESAMGQIIKLVATHKTGNSTTKNTYK